MNNLKIFKNDQFGEIRTVEENGTVLFCGKDIALALGYSDTKKAIVQHCQENGVAIYPLIDSMGREQQAKRAKCFDGEGMRTLADYSR